MTYALLGKYIVNKNTGPERVRLIEDLPDGDTARTRVMQCCLKTLLVMTPVSTLSCLVILFLTSTPTSSLC